MFLSSTTFSHEVEVHEAISGSAAGASEGLSRFLNESGASGSLVYDGSSRTAVQWILKGSREGVGPDN